MPSGYKLVITRALGMHGIYCTQPSGLTPSCFSAIYSIHPSCPCYNYNLSTTVTVPLSCRFIQKQGLDRTFVECDNHMWRVDMRPLPSEITVDGGSDWIVLHRNYSRYLVADKSKYLTDIKKYYEFSLLPAEVSKSQLPIIVQSKSNFLLNFTCAE